MVDVPIYTKAEMDAQLDRISALSAELETVKGEIEARDAEIAEWEHTSKRWDEWAKERADKLAAAEAKLAGGGAVKVKPLEWYEARISDKWQRYSADTILGSYEALEWSDGTYGGSIPAEDKNKSNHEFPADSIEAAKATAQADYERRILSALTHPAPTHNDGSGEDGDWRIDTSAGSPILVYQDCSVIQDEQAEYVLNLIRADHTSGEVTEARLLQAVEFVAKWCWRTDPPNANNKMTDAERLSVIKHHPTIAKYGRPHDELAEREAALRGDAS